MSAEQRAYLDTSALAKWYLNEAGSEAFVEFLQGLDSAVISSLNVTGMRSLLSHRRRMGDLSVELESVLFAALVVDIDRGWLQRYPLDDARFCGSNESDRALSGTSPTHAGCSASHGGRAGDYSRLVKAALAGEEVMIASSGKAQVEAVPWASAAVTARKDDAPAADQAAITNVVGLMVFSGVGGLIQTTSG